MSIFYNTFIICTMARYAISVFFFIIENNAKTHPLQIHLHVWVPVPKALVPA